MSETPTRTERTPRAPVRGGWLRAAVWALGGWIFLTVVISYIAGANFAVLKPERLPRAEDAFGAMVHTDQGTLALRYVAGEINRHLFTVYGWAQLVLGLVALVAVHASNVKAPLSKVAVFLCWVSTLAFLFFLVPQIVEYGMRLDLTPKVPVTPDRERFDLLHHASVGVEVGKLALLGFASLALVASRPTS